MPRQIVFDMRCLQDPTTSERGVPSHARATVQLARKVSPLARAARLTAITDARLPPLSAELAALADEVRPNAYLPELPAGAILINPAPMNPEQDVLARILLDARIAKAAIVYDFIPLDQPERYLGDPVHRLDYRTALTWLRRYDLFLPISESTEARLRVLMPRARQSAATGVPLSLFAAPEATAVVSPRHLLMVGGDDPRKNPEVVIRAHAGSQVLQRLRVPLVVTGNYPPRRRRDLQALAVTSGGDVDLLRLPGRLPAAALRELYRGAYGVVTPSFAEGFSLPVVEAMAAGVASLGSDIAVHAALLPDPSWRFDPDDAAALATMLEALTEDAGMRRRIVAAQAAIWPQFRAEAVVRKIWSAIETLAVPPAPPLIGTGRPRIAFVSPLPPARTGVADFSASFAKALARRAELTLFSSASSTPGIPPGSGQPFLAPDYDRVVCALGNSPHYLTIYQNLLRYGGACICHDHRLLGLHLTHFGAAPAAAVASRELGRKITRRQVAAWAEDETIREADLLNDIAAAARPLIFHNRHNVAALAARGLHAAFLPFAIYRPWDTARLSATAQADARVRLGLPAHERLIASFGFVGVLKGVGAAVEALALLRARGLPCRLLWVGDATYELAELQRLTAAAGVTDLVTFNTKFIGETQYRDTLLAADYGLQLRIGRPGSVSGALQDCIAAGLPSVANDDLADNLAAPGYVRRVGDELDPAAISAAFAELIKAEQPRAAHEQARRDYCQLYGMDNYVASLFTLLGL